MNAGVILFLIFAVCVLIGVPISMSLGIGSLAAVALGNLGVSPAVIAQRVFGGLQSTSIMAIAFFILAGKLMAAGGISRRIVNFANCLIGNIRGGMSVALVIACAFFAALSGSAPATVVAIGSMLYADMVKQGYPEDRTAGLLVIAGGLGPVIPPSIIMVLYCTLTGASVTNMFSQGMVIGILIMIVLILEALYYAHKEKWPKAETKHTAGEIGKIFLEAVPALMTPVIILGGIYSGLLTATESAAIAVIYSLLVSVFVYKGLDWKGVWHALDECVNTLSIVLILIATSAVFGNCLTMLHVPDLAANAITSVTSNPYIIALLIDLIILVLGMIMDMAPIILIATPILLPIATSIGIDPIQFGIIMVLNCGIGLLTPPVGAVLFIGSAVAKRPMEKVVKATLPFYLCMFIALLLLTFVPDISLAIPKLLGGYVSPITNPLGPVFIH